MVDLDRVSSGERMAAVSGVLLYILMSLDWFDVVGESGYNNLLIAFATGHAGQSAWEALSVISIVLLLAVVAAIAVALLRLLDAIHRPPVPVNAVVATLGAISALLILFRIVVPPDFGSEVSVGIDVPVEFVGTVQLPMVLSLLAAAGIALGAGLALWEDGVLIGWRRRWVERFG